MMRYVPTSARRILDVGCSNGEFGALLKRERKIEVWGLEPFSEAATVAATRLDRVIEGLFEPKAGLPASSFDCIVFNDVLEHLIDPSAALCYSQTLLAPGGVIVASVPNIRHFPTIWRLVIHGEWKYREWGTLDKTHLRFFTRSSLKELFEEHDYRVSTIEGINPYIGVPNASRRVWRLFKAADLLSRGRFSDMKYQQFAVVASASATAS
jgi:2-polyprenyl-3-methyl-5-hydroxy-6-metoxy-1,4-benzoquinol methylase